MTISPEKEAEICRLVEVEKWKVGTIVSQLGVHEDVVKRVLGLLEPKKRKKLRRPSKPRVRKIDPYVDFVKQTLTPSTLTKNQPLVLSRSRPFRKRGSETVCRCSGEGRR